VGSARFDATLALADCGLGNRRGRRAGGMRPDHPPKPQPLDGYGIAFSPGDPQHGEQLPGIREPGRRAFQPAPGRRSPGLFPAGRAHPPGLTRSPCRPGRCLDGQESLRRRGQRIRGSAAIETRLRGRSFQPWRCAGGKRATGAGDSGIRASGRAGAGGRGGGPERSRLRRAEGLARRERCPCSSALPAASGSTSSASRPGSSPG